MKNRTLITVSAAVLVAIVGFYSSRRNDAADPEKESFQAPVTSAGMQQSGAAPTNARSVAHVPAAQTRSAGQDNDFLLFTRDVTLLVDTGPAPTLTEAELTQIQGMYKELAFARMQFERSVARTEELSPQETLITVPQYQEYGDRLFRAFKEDLELLLGASRASDFLARNGELIVADNNGFGANEQTILVTRNPQNYRIAHASAFETKAPGVDTPAVMKRLSGSIVALSNPSRYSYLSAYFPR